MNHSFFDCPYLPQRRASISAFGRKARRRSGWANPLGVLTSDHAGYASFDLRRLAQGTRAQLAQAIAARMADPDAASKVKILVSPYAGGQPTDVFAQARFAFDAIVGRLDLADNTLPMQVRGLGGRTIQVPSLTDWRLSPASFAATHPLRVMSGLRLRGGR